MSDYRRNVVKSVHDRCKYVDASFDTLSFSAVVFLERCIWQPRASLSQSPTVSWLTSLKCFRNINRLGWETLTRRRSEARKLSTPLLVWSWLFATDTCENDYGQIPLRANSSPPSLNSSFTRRSTAVALHVVGKQMISKCMWCHQRTQEIFFLDRGLIHPFPE